MKEHQTIFSIKQLRRSVNPAFVGGIPDVQKKIAIVKKWQDNILNGRYKKEKEEAIKPLFLKQFFVEILGYNEDNPQIWHITAENKTDFDSTKADAALGFFKLDSNKNVVKDVRVTLEIKDARTTLDKPQHRKDFAGSAVEQGFAYAAKSGEKCKWVIVSNFLEIRLYLASDITKYEYFDVMRLTEPDEFKRFYYLLSFGNLFCEKINSTIDILLEDRLKEEKVITKRFYEEYRNLRQVFLQHLIDKNTGESPLDLLRYTQTIIDRILFVSVIKDFGLIEAQVFVKLKQTAAESWLNDNGELWRQMKGFFIALDKGSNRIHRFNGGLFKQNATIDALQIEDGALKNLLKLSEYDFQSDLNINILGHIFEQSITDIERLKQKLTTNSEKEDKGKRKKEGVFYTPENITKHIIKQTLGKWLSDKKEILNLNSISEYNNTEDTKKTQISRWLEYKTILNTVKIIDPACGSGAFLTQTFDYLLAEWLIVIDVLEKLDYNDTETLSQIKKNIVSNNLFGVDINPESIEITKLGLWLKSASKNDALALLDTNIKCGNSLIADPNTTENAFDWRRAFPTIFTKEHTGFDVIVGNPPYVFTRELISEAEKEYFKSNYQNTQFKINTYILFVEKSYQILHKNGYFGFIIPNNWLSLDKNSDFRQFILEKTANITIINMIDKIFEAASVDTSILFFQKQGKKEVILAEFAQNTFRNKNTVQSAVFLQNAGYIIQLDSDEHTKKLCEKIQVQGVALSEICKVNNGVQAYTVGEGNPKQTAEIRDKRLYHSTLQKNENWIKYIDGEDVQRYFMGWSGQYILYGTNLSRARRIELFQNPRILVRQIPAPAPYSIVANATNLFFINDNNSMIISEPVPNNGVCFRLNYILAVLNSRLMSYWFTKTFGKMERKIFPQFKINELSRFPIAAATDDTQQNIEILVQDLQAQMVIFNQKNKDFQVILQASFHDLKINNALKSIYALDFTAFIKQIEQQKIKITLKQKSECLPYFETYKMEINAVLSDINALNAEIDALIYTVYGLAQDEINQIEIG